MFHQFGKGAVRWNDRVIEGSGVWGNVGAVAGGGLGRSRVFSKAGRRIPLQGYFFGGHFTGHSSSSQAVWWLVCFFLNKNETLFHESTMLLHQETTTHSS